MLPSLASCDFQSYTTGNSQIVATVRGPVQVRAVPSSQGDRWGWKHDHVCPLDGRPDRRTVAADHGTAAAAQAGALERTGVSDHGRARGARPAWRRGACRRAASMPCDPRQRQPAAGSAAERWHSRQRRALDSPASAWHADRRPAAGDAAAQGTIGGVKRAKPGRVAQLQVPLVGCRARERSFIPEISGRWESGGRHRKPCW